MSEQSAESDQRRRVVVMFHCDAPECPERALQGQDAGWHHGKYDYCPTHRSLATPPGSRN